MMTRTHTPTPSNEEIIKTVTEIERKELGYEVEPLIPTLEELQAFTAAEAPDTDWIVFIRVHPRRTRYDVYSISEDMKRLELVRRIRQQYKTEREQIEAWDAIADRLFPQDERRPKISAKDAFYWVDQAHFEPIANFMLRTAGEPTPERLQWLHQAWLIALEADKNLKHPLAPLVRAWLQDQNAQRVTRAHDRKYTAAVLRHPLGSVRELAFTEQETGQVFKTPERVEQVQMELDLGDTPSVLPAIMPLQVVRTANLKPQTKSGAVSHELRIFFEAMMALQPNQQRADLMFRLGDLIDFLYPNGKFNWTNQMPHIKSALAVLHNSATVPWIDDQGSLREWRPVTVHAPLNTDATRDTPIFIGVQMPPDARSGYMVIKHIHRGTGMKSAAQWNAYHVAGFQWDKYGTVKGKLVDPKRPVERRDDQNQLVDASGKPIVKRNGKPINSPYDPEAVSQLDREWNEKAIDRYPVLSSEDLILACFPNGYPPRGRREYLRRAKAHWKKMEADGILVVRKERNGWRILPSSEHLNAHRALRKASKGVY